MMLDTSHFSKHNSISAYAPANWEGDIHEVIVELCEDDPSGFCATFYRNESDAEQETSHVYRVGASFLKNRLKKLRRAGFDAPMTKKAIRIIDKKRMVTLP